MRAWRDVRVLVVTALFIAGAPAQAVNWDQVTREATGILGRLLQYDTTNPPGQELEAARYVRDLLAQEGIAAQVYEPSPGRGNLLARIPGKGALRPVLFLAHLDVVGVEREHWTVDPFAGTVRDGYVYGRGAVDSKGLAAAETVAFLLVARTKVPLSRDLILLLVADEEAGGEAGARWMLEQHFDRLQPDFIFNEGGKNEVVGDQIQYFGVQTAEKRPFNFRLVAPGVAGHASVPRPDNAIYTLGRALARLSQHETRVRLNDTTRSFFRALAGLEENAKSCFARVEDPEDGGECARQVAKNLRYNAMMRDTISPTILRSGIRSNVLPATAEAVLNCRLLPETDAAEFADELRRAIADDRVQVLYGESTRPRTSPSPRDSRALQAYADAVRSLFPGMPVLATMGTGATDSAFFRARGIPAYGLAPFPELEESRAHGNDERLSVEGLSKGVRILYQTILNLQ